MNAPSPAILYPQNLNNRLVIGHVIYLKTLVIKSFGDLVKLVSHGERAGVVPQGAQGLDAAHPPLLLDHLLLLQLDGRLPQRSADAWGGTRANVFIPRLLLQSLKEVNSQRQGQCNHHYLTDI